MRTEGFLLSVLLVLLVIGYLSHGKELENLVPENTLTLVDDSGKYVKVPYPVKRLVILHSDAGEIVCALGAENLVVGVSDSVKAKLFPKFDNTEGVGRDAHYPTYEKIVELHPEVVITYSGSMGSEGQLRSILEPQGIRVLCLDAYRFELLPRDIRLLGLMLGKEKKAEEYARFFENLVEFIENRVSGLPVDNRVLVYWEGRKDYQTASYGTMGHDIVTTAGGLNVAAGEPVLYPVVSPEWVIERNPDVILKIAGGRILLGGGRTLTSSEPLKRIWEAVLSRPGWSELKAVRENRVYVMSWDLLGGGSLAIALCHAAKWFYPSLFQDLDPSSLHRQLVENFWGLEYRGIFTYP